MSATLSLRDATCIDGTGRAPFEVSSITVERDRIAALDGADGADLEIDCSGLTVLPGLIDAHAHLTIVDLSDPAGTHASAASRAATIFRVARLALEAGFTTVRDAGGADGGLAATFRAGLVPGPRVYPCGPIICQTGGHGDLRSPWSANVHHGVPGLYQFSTVIDGPDAARRVAREHFRRGATQLKVCVSGGVVSIADRLEDTQLSVDEVRPIVEEARARDSYVMAHTHNNDGIRIGLAAGIASFEHVSFLDADTASEIASAGAAVVPTLAVLHLMASDGPSWGLAERLMARVEGVEEAMVRAVKLAHDAGVPIGSGSDLLGPEQNRRGLELALKARILGPMAAIVAATKTNAEIMRIDDDLGTVEVGKLADLIAVDFDPLTEPDAFDDPARVVLVVKGGEIVKDARGGPS